MLLYTYYLYTHTKESSEFVQYEFLQEITTGSIQKNIVITKCTKYVMTSHIVFFCPMPQKMIHNIISFFGPKKKNLYYCTEFELAL